jgi:uncharacterized protein
MIPTKPILELALLSLPTDGITWQQGVLLLLIAPVFEEYVLRAGLHSRMSGLVRAKWLRVGLVAVAFGAIHLPRGWVLAIGVIPAGVLLGWVYERSISWRQCALLHSALNGVWLLVLISMRTR